MLAFGRCIMSISSCRCTAGASYTKADTGKPLTSGGHSCTGTGHDDGYTTAGAATAAGPGNRAVAGLPASANPNESVYVTHLANGLTQVTYVRWAYPNAVRAR